MTGIIKENEKYEKRKKRKRGEDTMKRRERKRRNKVDVIMETDRKVVKKVRGEMEI